jgi:hypothetical protein
MSNKYKEALEKILEARGSRKRLEYDSLAQYMEFIATQALQELEQKTFTLEDIGDIIRDFEYNRCTKNWCDGDICDDCKYNVKNMILAEFERKKL